MGRGPMGTDTVIIKDAIFIRLKGVLTPVEEKLMKTAEGAELIKEIRVQLLGGARHLQRKIIIDIMGCKISSLHSDISTKTGEKIIVFILDRNFKIKILVIINCSFGYCASGTLVHFDCNCAMRSMAYEVNFF